jgi:hypothetical protein
MPIVAMVPVVPTVRVLLPHAVEMPIAELAIAASRPNVRLAVHVRPIRIAIQAFVVCRNH